MIRTTMTALAVVLATGAAGSAMAATETTDTELFGKIDTDDDGVITLDELRTDSEDWFLEVDADGNGKITQDEMLSGSRSGGLFGTKARRLFLDLDMDSDGKVSRAEFVADAESVYRDAVARAPDGRLTTADYAESVRQRDEPVQLMDLDEDGDVTEDEAAADFEQTFTMLDDDADGILTEAEWGDADVAMAEVDADGDGQVTRQEYMAYGESVYADLADPAPEEGRVTTADYTERRTHRDEPWELVDLDDDQYVSEEEAQADWVRRFQRLDVDDDGELTRDELARRVGPDVGELQEQAAGGMTREDYMIAQEQEFAEADLDGDGEVTVWEYRTYRVN